MLFKFIVLLSSIVILYSQDMEYTPTSEELVTLLNNKNTRKVILKKINQDFLLQRKIL